METLQGGREWAIYRKDDVVLRPANHWTMTVHLFLKHLHSNGFHACPKPISIEKGKEILTYVDGQSYNYPLNGPISSIIALKSAAKMLRNLHDASANFLNDHQDTVLHWMLPERLPKEVICHGDFMPYNVALDGECVVGVFDFDTIHPAPRVWDIAMSVYGWAPFKTNEYDKLGTLEEQIRRAKLFCDSYGCSRLDREELVEVMTLRLTALVNYMRTMATKGDASFQANMQDCHHDAYLQDIEYLRKHRRVITQGLLD
ncbi:hypothetical protein ACOMICROBIO_GDFFDHBD_02692 [Vibrio sp. B1REV9]|uniref:phosphotransferase enzyme family protein n=1 Tax=Vibrio sp. B1REV9 TaxID=2751179 RepID=UPI001AFA620A|nr:aminoglycoside phosphotransferase family protein [Vibrio sp. B1REV9]CAE6932476.1 hypothetical protein ACOMICROBIO_GDFFDHBD_02692 [Vibrio sp. B1REV9]